MQTGLIRHIAASKGLSDFVREYQVVRFCFNKDSLLPVKFHAPRPEHRITFYPKDPQKFSYIGSSLVNTYPSCVINGTYTIPLNRHGGRDFLAIKVVLKPSILFHLTRIPLPEITNSYIDAEDVWGSEVTSTCERLTNCVSLDEMISVIETFMKMLLRQRLKPFDTIDKVANFLFENQDPASVEWLARESCFSLRQFIRKYEARVGVGANTFQRIVRFDKAFRMKNNHPNLDWLSIAIRSGYYDYQHLVKDYKKFTNLLPNAFYEAEKKSPERVFGLIEE